MDCFLQWSLPPWFFLDDEGFEQSIKKHVDFRPVGFDRAMNYDQYMLEIEGIILDECILI